MEGRGSVPSQIFSLCFVPARCWKNGDDTEVVPPACTKCTKLGTMRRSSLQGARGAYDLTKIPINGRRDGVFERKSLTNPLWVRISIWPAARRAS